MSTVLNIVLHFLTSAQAFLLMAELGSDEYAVREEAQARLFAMEDDAVPALWVGHLSKDPEIRGRSDRGLQDYYDIWAGYDRLDSSFLGAADKEHYYQLAWDATYPYENFEVRDSVVSHYALKLYFFDRMRAGMTRQEALTKLARLSRAPPIPPPPPTEP